MTPFDISNQLVFWEDDKVIDVPPRVANPSDAERSTEMVGQHLVTLACESQGYPTTIARPGLAYDLITQAGCPMLLLKIQVKATEATSNIDGTLLHQFHATRGASARRYRRDEVDIFAFVYVPKRAVLFKLFEDVATSRAGGVPMTIGIKPGVFEHKEITEASLSCCVTTLLARTNTRSPASIQGSAT